MSNSVIALYHDFESARQAVEALVDAGFKRDDISIVASDADQKYASELKVSGKDNDVKSGQGARFGAVVGGLVGLGVALIPGIGPVLAAGPLAAAVMTGIGVAAGAATGGVAAGLIDLGMPEAEAHKYAEGIRQGGTLVTVNLDKDEHVARAESILNRYNPVNVNEQDEVIQRDNVVPSTSPRNVNVGVNAGEQQKLNVVEEQVQVGKREVEGDTVRVHTRVTEHPVQQQVNLREEHVTVDRHPVDRAASTADLDAFQEGTIELTEKHEEPVVSKTARVVEEVVVGKQASERTETVQETVRRKDVEVEGAVGKRTYDDYAKRFRTNYDTNYASSGSTWETYSPAYQLGYELANDNRYQNQSWDRVEADAQRRWETTNPNTWQKFKDAVRNAWDDVRGQN
ncbi:MAG: YsnF/AvaK domain-containing protein [Chloroflexota bacterium]